MWLHDVHVKASFLLCTLPAPTLQSLASRAYTPSLPSRITCRHYLCCAPTCSSTTYAGFRNLHPTTTVPYHLPPLPWLQRRPLPLLCIHLLQHHIRWP